MPKPNVRVLLASESPQAKHFLREVIEEEKAVIVGEAENALKALTLTRNLRPDIAVIDYSLPHVVSLESVPQSRMGGLDTARVISEEMPNIRVVLVTNTDGRISHPEALPLDFDSFLCREEERACIPFRLQELCHDTAEGKAVIFANIEVKPRPSQRQKGVDLGGAALFIGGLSILVGLGLAATMALAPVGLFLAAVGGAAMFLGAVAKLIGSVRTPRSK